VIRSEFVLQDLDQKICPSLATESSTHLMNRLSYLATDPHIELLLTLRQGRAIPSMILAKKSPR
jgi:hypothetical protein